jgi:hypothetical protein
MTWRATGPSAPWTRLRVCSFGTMGLLDVGVFGAFGGCEGPPSRSVANAARKSHERFGSWDFSR